MKLGSCMVIRSAGWPVEAIDALADESLVAEIDFIEDLASRIGAGSAPLQALIYGSVPDTDEPALRHWLLEVGRTVRAGDAPWPPAPAGHDLAARWPAIHATLEQQDADRRALRARRQALAVRFEISLHAQRRALRQLAAQERFCSALAIANPLLASHWRARRTAALAASSMSRTLRQLDGVLARQLARAVGRTTPHGAWSTSALAQCLDGASHPGAEVQVRPVAPRCQAEPDLRPFAHVLGMVRRGPTGWRMLPLRADPGARQSEGEWIGASGAAEATVLVNLLMDNLRDGRELVVGDLLEALSVTGDVARLEAALQPTVARLLELGVLTHALALAPAAESAWQALEAASARLPPALNGPWDAAVKTARRVCDRVCAEGPMLPDLKLLEAHGALHDAMVALHRAAGLPPPEPTARLVVDTLGPRTLALPDTVVRRLRDAVSGVLAVHASHGGAEAFRAHRLGGLRDVSLPLMTLVAGQSAFDGAALAAANACSGMPTPSPVAHAGRAGSMAFGIASAQGAVWFRWGRPQPDFATWRIAKWVDGPLGSPDTPDEPEFEVVGIDPAHPNLALREAGGRPQVGRHAGTAVKPVECTVDIDDAGRGWLVPPGAPNGRRWRPVYSATSAIGVDDPVGRLLLRLAMSHGWEYLAFGFPAPAPADEGGEPEPLPTHHSDLQAPAWRLTAAAVKSLRGLSGLERFAAWRRWVRRLGMGRWLWVGPVLGGTDSQSLIRTDSPLMVECVLAPLLDDNETLLLVAPPGHPHDWPLADDSGHYLAEIVVTWHVSLEQGP